MQITETLQHQINFVRKSALARLDCLDKRIKFLQTTTLFDGLEAKMDLYGSSIDLNYLTREEVMRVIMESKRKWIRSANGARLCYQCEIDGITIMLWDAAKPPSCTVVKRTVHVEAHDDVIEEISCKLPVKTEEPEADLLADASKAEEQK